MLSTSKIEALRRLRGLAPSLAAFALVTAVAWLCGLLEPVSLLVTVGGALAVERATFSMQRIRAAWLRLADALREPDHDARADAEAAIASLKRLARIHRIEGPPALERAAYGERDAFVRTAVQRALEIADAEDLRGALLGEARREVVDGEAARQVFLTLGKLLPAFGLIGTLTGLALMLPRVGGADVAAVGPGLGVAVLTTLYGAFLSNAVVLPLATKLQASIERRWLARQTIVAGVELLHRRELPTRVERAMRSFAGLPPKEESGEIVLLTERAA